METTEEVSGLRLLCSACVCCCMPALSPRWAGLARGGWAVGWAGVKMGGRERWGCWVLWDKRDSEGTRPEGREEEEA